MSKMVQIRNVPDGIHRRLKVRAAQEGRSLSEYLLGELARIAERPSRRELLERLAEVTRAELRPSPAELLRAERANR